MVGWDGVPDRLGLLSRCTCPICSAVDCSRHTTDTTVLYLLIPLTFLPSVCFDSDCPYLSLGEPSLRKQSPECAVQEQSPAKRVVTCDLTGSEGSVEAVGVSSSAQVVNRRSIAAERSLPIYEGELC